MTVIRFTGLNEAGFLHMWMSLQRKLALAVPLVVATQAPSLKQRYNTIAKHIIGVQAGCGDQSDRCNEKGTSNRVRSH